MSKKPNPLRQAMLEVQKEPTPSTPAVPQRKEKGPSSQQQSLTRFGKRQVSVYYGPDAHKQLRLLAIETESTIQALMEEALNDLFRKYNKSAVV